MGTDLVVPFGLVLFGLGLLVGTLAARRDWRRGLGVWCPYCLSATRLRRAHAWRKVIVCQNCDRAIGHEEMFQGIERMIDA